MLIVDAHLDLAYNAQRGRDPRMPAKQQPVVEGEVATVGLPDLRQGNVGLVCATIFCEPQSPGHSGYTNADEARQQALKQLMWYRSCIDQGLIRFIQTPNDIGCVTGVSPVRGDVKIEKTPEFDRTAHGRDARDTNAQLNAILLLEGADALRTPDDVKEWFDAGMRIVGLAWRRTRFAGGTGAPGPLTAEGRALIKELDRFGIIHDTSHLAEESFWELLDRTNGPIIASHSNCRAIVGEGDRHLTDEMIKAIAQRGGVIGINFFDKFLLPKSEYGKRRATLNDVGNHIKHICDLTGSAKHVGLGTDMDGGLGREQIPVEIQTSADLARVTEALLAARFSDQDMYAVMGLNWQTAFGARLMSSA